MRRSGSLAAVSCHAFTRHSSLVGHLIHATVTTRSYALAVAGLARDDVATTQFAPRPFIPVLAFAEI